MQITALAYYTNGLLSACLTPITQTASARLNSGPVIFSIDISKIDHYDNQVFLIGVSLVFSHHWYGKRHIEKRQLEIIRFFI